MQEEYYEEYYEGDDLDLTGQTQLERMDTPEFLRELALVFAARSVGEQISEESALALGRACQHHRARLQHHSIDLYFHDGLSVRTYNVLHNNGIKTLEQIGERTERELMALKNFGRTCLEEVRDLMRREAVRWAAMIDDEEATQPNDIVMPVVTHTRERVS